MEDSIYVFDVKRRKTRAYQVVSLLKQSSDFFISAKTEIIRQITILG